MTSVRIFWLLLCLFWVATEIMLTRKTSGANSHITEIEQRSQWFLWLALTSGLGLAFWFKALAWASIPIAYLPRQGLALVLFAAGLSIRCFAIAKLGQFFTTHVTIHNEHELIKTGPYRWLRHPAYTGLLLALAAAGLAMGDAVALLVLIIPAFFAFRFRIAIEEKMLQEKFGDAYLDYSKTTWKVLPWVF
jgi:protein-S-isoprenylcysteine O-methyltransferase Ste14